MTQRLAPAFTLLALFPAWAVAQQPSEEPADGPWSGTAEVSLVATSGNSDTRTFGLGGELTYDPGIWRLLARASFVESEADDELRARSQSALLETSRAFSEHLEVYGRGGYLRDLFAGIERRITTEGGLAYHAIATEAHSLQVLAGVGFTDEQRAAGGDRSLGTANATGRYRWAVTETSALTEEAGFVADLNAGDDWRFTNEVAATAALSTRLSLKVSHKLSFLNEPVPGFRKTDAILSAALVANF
jgi:putative salt-induced outer membrane protein YdiY